MLNKVFGRTKSSDVYSKPSSRDEGEDVMFMGGQIHDDEEEHVCYQMIADPEHLDIDKTYFENLLVGTTSDAKKCWPDHEAQCIKEKLDVGKVCQWKHLMKIMKEKTL